MRRTHTPHIPHIHTSHTHKQSQQDTVQGSGHEGVGKALFPGAQVSGVQLHGVAEHHHGHTNVEPDVDEVVPELAVW